MPAPLPDASLSTFLVAVADATEEAIYNSLLQARSVTGREGRNSVAIPLERVQEAFGEPTGPNAGR